MKKISLTLIASVFLMYACKKNDEGPAAPNPEPEITINEFFPMNIGNYWVYEYIGKAPDGSIIGIDYDTLKIVKDTLINSNEFMVFHKNKPAPNSEFYRRDSLGFIVNPNGEVVLIPSANESIYNFHYSFNGTDTVFSYWEEYMDDVPFNILNQNYSCLAKIQNHEVWPAYGGNMGIDTNLYSEIGQLTHSYSYSSGVKVTGTLIDYHLEE